MKDVCDVVKTEELDRLFKVPIPERNEDWKAQMYACVPLASLSLPENHVFVGPDGFAYLILNIPKPGQTYQSVSLLTVLEHCLQRGLGVVISEADAMNPYWVFPYGMLWSLKEFENFEVPHEEHLLGQRAGDVPHGEWFKETVTEKRQIMVGQPSDDYLPPYARVALRDFFVSRLNIQNPQVFLLVDPAVQPMQSLVFSVFPDHFENEDEYGAVLSILRWYLPNHYGLSGIPRDSDLAKSFLPL